MPTPPPVTIATLSFKRMMIVPPSNSSRKIYRAKTPSKQNPKSEYRNPKQTRRQINLESGKSKTPNLKEACLEF
jgi:hypothetical protein